MRKSRPRWRMCRLPKLPRLLEQLFAGLFDMKERMRQRGCIYIRRHMKTDDFLGGDDLPIVVASTAGNELGSGRAGADR